MTLQTNNMKHHRFLSPTAFLISLFILNTIGCDICPGQGAVGNFQNKNANLSISFSPIGNPALTKTTLTIQGNTSASKTREFLVSFGMNSNTGKQGKVTPYHDKVTLYTSISATKGTGDVWSINPLVTQNENSGEYNAQGIELDFNNNNKHRGEGDAGSGLAPPVSYGLSVTGAGAYRSTSGFMLSGPGTHRIWNRGIVFANDCVEQSTFQDLGNPIKSIDIRGNPVYGIYQSSTTSKNYFAGKSFHDNDVEMKSNLILNSPNGQILRRKKDGSVENVLEEMFLTERKKRFELENKILKLEKKLEILMKKIIL